MDLLKLHLDNPLLSAIGPFIPYEDLLGAMVKNGLSGIDISSIPLNQREDQLFRYTEHIAPTTYVLEVADTLQTLVRDSYHRRNPLLPEVRKKMSWLYGDAAKDLYATLPFKANLAGGATFRGITGLGKTTTVQRYLSLFPEQVKVHQNGEIPGFSVLKQITWMMVDMSSDGSRGGLLKAMISACDRLLGTSYYDQYVKKSIGIETLLVAVAQILITHRTGVLVLDEIQIDNFDATFSRQLTAFFLRLLNFGVPVVLIGNPYGFEEHGLHAQTVRRWTEGGGFLWHPFERGTENWKSFIKHILTFNVMPTPLVQSQEIDDLFFDLSGGFPDFAFRIYREAQKWAIRMKHDKVTREHLFAAYNSRKLEPNHLLIKGFVQKESALLLPIKDVPHGYYAARWQEEREAAAQKMNDLSSETALPGSPAGAQNGNEGNPASNRTNSAAEDDGVHPISGHVEGKSQQASGDSIVRANARIRSVKLAAETRSKNSVDKNADLLKKLDADDMRNSGCDSHRLTDFSELRCHIEDD